MIEGWLGWGGGGLDTIPNENDEIENLFKYSRIATARGFGRCVFTPATNITRSIAIREIDPLERKYADFKWIYTQ